MSVLLEGAEARQCDGATLLDRGHHDIKERIQNATSFCFGQFMLGSQMLNQFAFVHLRKLLVAPATLQAILLLQDIDQVDTGLPPEHCEKASSDRVCSVIAAICWV